MAPASIELGPGETAAAEITFDPSSEPDFRGQLLVRLTGRAEDDSVVFEAKVDVGVREEAKTGAERSSRLAEETTSPRR